MVTVCWGLVGEFLGCCYWQDLVVCCILGLGLKHAGCFERERLLTAAISSRWAGSITCRADDRVVLGVGNMKAWIERSWMEINRIEKRFRVPVGQRQGCVSGFAFAGERWQKQRWLQKLKACETQVSADLQSRSGVGVCGQ